MSVKIGHAVGDENGKARGGFAGDQTGREVLIQDWYKRKGGWEVCIVPTDTELGKRAAAAMTAICKNDKIGYNQDRRWTARAAIQIAGSIEGAPESEVDCSSAVDIAYEQAGLAIERGYTGNLERRYMATGKFKAYRDAEHLESADYAVAGTLYLTAGQHVAMVLEDGPLAYSSPSSDADAPPVNVQPAASEADDMTPPYVLALQDTNIRSGPGKKFPKLSGNSILYAGQIAKYEETDEDSGWYGVTTRYGTGFISCRADLTKLVM